MTPKNCPTQKADESMLLSSIEKGKLFSKFRNEYNLTSWREIPIFLTFQLRSRTKILKKI